MVNFCGIINCGNRSEREKKSFFRLPAILSRGSQEERELSKRRRQKWILAIKRADLTEGKLKYLRVCEDHFLTGKPSDLTNISHPDWIPTQRMGYGLRLSEDALTRYGRASNRKRLLLENSPESCQIDHNLQPSQRNVLQMNGIPTHNLPNWPPPAERAQSERNNVQTSKEKMCEDMNTTDIKIKNVSSVFKNCVAIEYRNMSKNSNMHLYRLARTTEKNTKPSFVNCCVPQCHSVKIKNPNLSFHKFPKNDRIRKAWIYKLRIGKELSSNMCVCSKHFAPSDYIQGMPNPRKKYLKKVSVPSLCLPKSSVDTKPDILKVAKKNKKYATLNKKKRNPEMLPITCPVIKQEVVEDDLLTEIPTILEHRRESSSSTTSTSSETDLILTIENRLANLKKSLADRVKECEVLRATLLAFEKEKEDLILEISDLESQLSSKSAGKLSENEEPSIQCGMPNKLKVSFKAHVGSINALLWDSESPITAGSDGKIRFWDLENPPVPKKEIRLPPQCSVFSADLCENRSLFCASYKNQIQVWSASLVSQCILEEHTGVVPTVKFINPLDHMVSGCLDGIVKFWDLSRACSTISYDGASAVNDVVGISEHCVASGHNDGKVRFWDSRIRGEISCIQLDVGASSLDISSDKSLLLTSEVDGSVRIFDSREFTELRLMQAANRSVVNQWTRARFNPDGRLCCRGSIGGTVNVWEAESGILQQTLKWGDQAVMTCAWSSCGMYFASSMADQCSIWSTHISDKDPYLLFSE